ncbi:Ankyrin repeat protein [Giardia duodenalis]|uniref:Ankyrin repeat protein n=1 Tax=Giardia intestinalis TaxID=5741 RepID=V6TU49_GIAIN|nr:Ankyrin repeat protein [Giardia intestinalis]
MLMCAAALGDVEMVSQHLGEKGQRDKQGRTALILGAQRRRDEAVKFLIKHESGVSSWTNLMYAAYLGDIDAVRNNLHEKGCKDITGMTALMWAAYQGHKEVAEILLKHEKGIRDNEGNTAYMHTLKTEHEDIATILGEHEATSWTPLMYAAFVGDFKAARQHLFSKYKKNSDGDTALILAARAGQGAMLELLDPTDEDEVTALMQAAERGDVEAVRALIPLQKGRKMTEDVIINGWLISHGTALMRAVACRHAKVVRLLVEHEGGMQDDCGYTALMWAAYSNNPECVKLLARKEKDMKTTREWSGFPPGTMALNIARRKNHTEIVPILSG